MSFSTPLSLDQLDFRSNNFITIQVQRYKCVALCYQSLEDWTQQTDIMQCNPDFHSCPCYDCVAIHEKSPHLTIGHLRDLFQCWLPSGTVIDIAVINRLWLSKWKPKTMWNGCQILAEDQAVSLVQVDYLLRGALVCPVSDNPEKRNHYIVDSVDADMFLQESSL